MNITTSTLDISVYVLTFDFVDLDNFEEEFKSFLEQHSQVQNFPLYIQCSDNMDLSVPDTSILIDSLKDVGIYVSGLISADKGVKKFSEHLGIPCFDSIDAISDKQSSPIEQSGHNTPPEKTLVDQVTQESPVQERESHLPLQNSYEPPHATSFENVDDSYEKLVQESKEINAQVPRLPSNPKSEQERSQTKEDNVVQQETQSSQATSVDDVNHGLTQPDHTPLLISDTIVTGQHIRRSGDVVLLGVLEQGAVISSTGSVYCYNQAHGTILAGASGNADAKIYTKYLNCEAVAIAGYYAKNHQYSHVQTTLPLIISLSGDNLNFNSLDSMPQVKTLGIEDPQGSADVRPKVRDYQDHNDPHDFYSSSNESLPQHDSLNYGTGQEEDTETGHSGANTWQEELNRLREEEANRPDSTQTLHGFSQAVDQGQFLAPNFDENEERVNVHSEFSQSDKNRETGQVLPPLGS